MASACPRCGFAYGWDGTNCSHCRWEYLRPVDKVGEAVVWVPYGGEAHALWNILLPYTR
jgi:ribosomal protein L40E